MIDYLRYVEMTLAQRGETARYMEFRDVPIDLSQRYHVIGMSGQKAFLIGSNTPIPTGVRILGLTNAISFDGSQELYSPIVDFEDEYIVECHEFPDSAATVILRMIVVNTRKDGQKE